MVQANIVQSLLSPQYEIEIVQINTIGDKILDMPLAKIGGKALFTKELESALQHNLVDIVVHSLKDVGTIMPEGLILGCVLERANPCDVLVLPLGKTGCLNDLPNGAVVGTGSVRRIGQLKRSQPDIEFRDVRGNLGTRLSKLDASDSPYAALVLAHAGLQRLGKHDRISMELDTYYAIGQGAIAIQCRANDAETLAIISNFNHEPTLIKVTAERAFMRELEGGCSVPLGVLSFLESGKLTLKGCVCSVNGLQELLEEFSAIINEENPLQLRLQSADLVGIELAKKMIDKGAKELLGRE